MNKSSSLSDVDFIKSGHTLSLDGHNIEPTDMVHSRSARVLHSRGTSYPVLAADLSSDFTQENIRRRTAHRDVLTADHTSFRRRAVPEGTSSILNEKRRIKDFLCDVHKLKDLGDINPSHKERLTFSIRKDRDIQEGTAYDEYKYNTLRPLEDFIRPEDTNSPRLTGYEHGHIRSLLKLDVYGPASSQLASRERAIGKIPRTPSMDRYFVSEPNGCGSPTSRVSTASSISNYEFAEVQGGKNTMAKRSLKYNSNGGGQQNVDMRQMRDMFHLSSNTISDTQDKLLVTRSTVAAAAAVGDKLMVNFHNTFSNPTTAALLSQQGHKASLERSLRRTTGSSSQLESRSSYRGQAISTADRLPLDPLLKRTMWFKTYTKNEQDRKNELRAVQKESRYQREQRLLAESERQSLQDFEKHLTLARIQV